MKGSLLFHFYVFSQTKENRGGMGTRLDKMRVG